MFCVALSLYFTCGGSVLKISIRHVHFFYQGSKMLGLLRRYFKYFWNQSRGFTTHAWTAIPLWSYSAGKESPLIGRVQLCDSHIHNGWVSRFGTYRRRCVFVNPFISLVFQYPHHNSNLVRYNFFFFPKAEIFEIPIKKPDKST